MLNLEAITLRHLTEDKMEGKTFHEGHIVIDLFNCVREVKAARTEAAKAENENARDLEVARQERDEARRMLAECYVLSGGASDCGKCRNGDPEEAGDEAEPEPEPGDRVTVENVADRMSAPELARRQAGAAFVEALDVLSAAFPRAVALAREEERAAERTAVVAWLRVEERDYAVGHAPLDAADCIERGEHRREGDE